jgi:HK97 family phage portal protein
MGKIKEFIEQRVGLNVKNPAYWLGSGGNPTSSGVVVTPASAMRTSAVWACVRVLSYTLAALPVHILYNNPNGSKEKDIDIDVYKILHKEPNPEISSFTYHKLEMTNAALHGNAYAEIEFDEYGKSKALWPIPPWCCEPMRTQSKELFYRVYLDGETKNLQPYRVLHVMGLGTDGMKGLSPIRQHAETIGISLAAEKFGGLFFGNGMNVGGVAEHPKILTAEGSKNLSRSLNEEYGGLGNSHRLLLLEEGMKYQKVGIPPNEAQFLETRQFQIEDIARIFGVQLHKIGHLLRSTFSNIEHQGMEFVTDTMLPWVVNFEQEYNRKLLDDRHYVKFSLEGLLRGDSAARASFYRELYYLGALCADEAREKEDMNPISDGLGKRYYIQANMIPVDKVDEYLEKNTAKTGDAQSSSNNRDAARALLADAVRRIAEREKRDIIRQAKKNPEQVAEWLTEFYRDFREFIIKQVEPALGDRAGEYADRYIAQSKHDLGDVAAADMESALTNWETSRPMPSLTGLV